MDQYIGLAGAPFIWAIIQWVVKPLDSETRTYPAIAVLLGLAINVAIALNRHTDMLTAVLIGITTGLAAIGANSGTSNTLKAQERY